MDLNDNRYMNLSNISRNDLLDSSNFESLRSRFDGPDKEDIKEVLAFLKFLAKNLNDHEWKEFQKESIDSYDEDDRWPDESSGPKKLGKLEDLLKKL